MLELPPPERVSRESVTRYFQEGEQRLKHRSIATLLSSLAETMIAMHPERDWQWLRNSSKSFVQSAAGQDARPIPQLSAQEIFAWAMQRLSFLRDQAKGAVSAAEMKRLAIEHRQALALAFLASWPVRLRSLLSMTLSYHVQRQKAELVIRFRAKDMKNRRAAVMSLTGDIVAHFDDYLAIHRPALLDGRTSDALWISERGNDYGAGSMCKQMANYYRRHFGVGFRIHAMRYVVATSIAETAPEKAGIIRDILGHSTMRVAERYYNKAKSRSLSREQSKLVDGDRRHKPRGRKPK